MNPVAFFALIIGGVIVSTASLTAGIVGPIQFSRGRRDVLRTIKAPKTPRL